MPKPPEHDVLVKLWSDVDTPMFYVSEFTLDPALPFHWAPIINDWSYNYQLGEARVRDTP
jgi:hypothetical protein